MNLEKYLFYDKNGFYSHQDDTNSRYETTLEYKNSLFDEINVHSLDDNLYGEWKIVPDSTGKPIVKYVERPIEELKGILRRLRTNRVFPIINRSNMWFNSLTQQQKNELQVWYQAWLDVTDTLVVPDRPAWLD